MAVFALSNFAAGNFFFSDKRKLHSAFRATVVFNPADNGEDALAALHFVSFQNFGVDVLS